MPATEATFMKCPEPAARKSGKAAAMPWSTPLMLTSIMRSHSSTFSSSNNERHEPGIANRNIEPTEPLLRPLDECSKIRALGDVNRHRFGFATIPLKFSSERLQPVVAASPEHHPGPVTCKIPSRRLADSAARAGDCNHLPLDSRHPVISSNADRSIAKTKRARGLY